MMKHKNVDAYFEGLSQWKSELALLRTLVLECGLDEALKWNVPCYTYQDTNVVILSGFKEYCVVSFLKGVLLSDTENLLVSPGENSQSVRFMKFTHKDDILKSKEQIKNYLFEAIEVEKAGLKVDLSKSKDFDLIAELKHKIDTDPTFKEAFEGLTIGRQRAYNMYIGQAKQSTTRLSRIESYTERILSGKGMNDCICGHSKRMPNCDGSHKYL